MSGRGSRGRGGGGLGSGPSVGPLITGTRGCRRGGASCRGGMAGGLSGLELNLREDRMHSCKCDGTT